MARVPKRAVGNKFFIARCTASAASFDEPLETRPAPAAMRLLQAAALVALLLALLVDAKKKKKTASPITASPSVAVTVVPGVSPRRSRARRRSVRLTESDTRPRADEHFGAHHFGAHHFGACIDVDADVAGAQQRGDWIAEHAVQRVPDQHAHPKLHGAAPAAQCNFCQLHGCVHGAQDGAGRRLGVLLHDAWVRQLHVIHLPGQLLL